MELFSENYIYVQFITERMEQRVHSHPQECGGFGKGIENLKWPLPENLWWQNEPNQKNC